MPVLWFEQHVVADKTLSSLVKLALAGPLIGTSFGVVVILIGVILIALSVVRKREKVSYEMKEKNLMALSDGLMQAESLPLVKSFVLKK
jgi:uncharacterized membrane protein YidH (DUF202 family)